MFSSLFLFKSLLHVFLIIFLLQGYMECCLDGIRKQRSLTTGYGRVLASLSPMRTPHTCVPGWSYTLWWSSCSSDSLDIWLLKYCTRERYVWVFTSNNLTLDYRSLSFPSRLLQSWMTVGGTCPHLLTNKKCKINILVINNCTPLRLSYVDAYNYNVFDIHFNNFRLFVSRRLRRTPPPPPTPRCSHRRKTTRRMRLTTKSLSPISRCSIFESFTVSRVISVNDDLRDKTQDTKLPYISFVRYKMNRKNIIVISIN